MELDGCSISKKALIVNRIIQYMQSLIGSIAASFGIPPQMASAAVSGVTSLVLQKQNLKQRQVFYLLCQTTLQVNSPKVINKSSLQGKQQI
jgi:hypothetical protein